MNKIKIKLDVDNVIKFVTITRTYISDINVYKGSGYVDGKSIDDIMTYDLSQPVEVMLISDDEVENNLFFLDMRHFLCEV